MDWITLKHLLEQAPLNINTDKQDNSTLAWLLENKDRIYSIRLEKEHAPFQTYSVYRTSEDKTMDYISYLHFISNTDELNKYFQVKLRFMKINLTLSEENDHSSFNSCFINPQHIYCILPTHLQAKNKAFLDQNNLVLPSSVIYLYTDNINHTHEKIILSSDGYQSLLNQYNIKYLHDTSRNSIT